MSETVCSSREGVSVCRSQPYLLCIGRLRLWLVWNVMTSGWALGHSFWCSGQWMSRYVSVLLPVCLLQILLFLLCLSLVFRIRHPWDGGVSCLGARNICICGVLLGGSSIRDFLSPGQSQFLAHSRCSFGSAIWHGCAGFHDPECVVQGLALWNVFSLSLEMWIHLLWQL